MHKTVLLGMSGGVDSTVTAVLLQEQGYAVTGVYMRLHDNPAYHEANITRARKVADYLGIDLHIHDLTETFQANIIDYFVSAYAEGITPNPCVICNRTIKFGAMVDFADTLGIDYVATGHYVRNEGGVISMAADKSKDQSYFLAEVRSEVLPRLIFPLGEWVKEDVKAYAARIPVLADFASQKESQEICFVENDDYVETLSQYLPVDQPGEVLDTEGHIVGSHKGYLHYTIGKRRGFTVDGAHDPHYVADLDPEHNRITVAKRDALYADRFAIKRINLHDPRRTFACEIKVRYRTRPVHGHVTIEGDSGTVQLSEPVFGLAKGQFAVFYEGERLLGGGEIM